MHYKKLIIIKISIQDIVIEIETDHNLFESSSNYYSPRASSHSSTLVVLLLLEPKYNQRIKVIHC